jgi:hypothetical protein
MQVHTARPAEGLPLMLMMSTCAQAGAQQQVGAPVHTPACLAGAAGPPGWPPGSLMPRRQRAASALWAGLRSR